METKARQNKLKRNRQWQGLTTKELGELAGVSYRLIRYYEQGKYKLNQKQREAIAAALHIKITALFDDKPCKERTKTQGISEEPTKAEPLEGQGMAENIVNDQPVQAINVEMPL